MNENYNDVKCFERELGLTDEFCHRLLRDDWSFVVKIHTLS